uniref:Uncharacterized protein n=1 Tax=Aegilops tauschii subsp. strangulata TaxID=200361 RepID=A0A453Q216_AEGTS
RRGHAFCGGGKAEGVKERWWEAFIGREKTRQETPNPNPSIVLDLDPLPPPAGNPWRCATWPRSCGSPPLLLPGSRRPPPLLLSGSHRTLAFRRRPFLGSRYAPPPAHRAPSIKSLVGVGRANRPIDG